MLYRYFLVGLVIVLCLPAFAQLSEEPKETGSPLSQKQKSTLQNLLPDISKMNLKLAEDPLFYAPHNLYEYINGAADVFLEYDFENLITAQYKKGEIEITLDIYNMGTTLNAFGIYSAERSPNYDFIDIGVEGTINPYGINFLQDQYYIKISAYGPEQKLQPILRRFAEAVSKKINTKGSFPCELKLFLKKNKVEHSEKYIKTNPLGYEFLPPVFLATYQFEDSESLLALSLFKNKKKAHTGLAKLRKNFERSKAGIEAIQIKNRPGIVIDSKYRGKLIAVPVGSSLVIVKNPPENAENFLNNFVSNMTTNMKQPCQKEQK